MAFLKAIGCREAARQQNTAMTTSRRHLSNSASTTSFWSIFKKPFRRTKTLNCDDITSFQVNDVSHVLDTSVPQHYNPFPLLPTHTYTYTQNRILFSLVQLSLLDPTPATSSIMSSMTLQKVTLILWGGTWVEFSICPIHSPFPHHLTHYPLTPHTPSSPPHTLPLTPHTIPITSHTTDRESFSSDNTPEVRSKPSLPNGPHLSPPSTPTIPCNGPHP